MSNTKNIQNTKGFLVPEIQAAYDAMVIEAAKDVQMLDMYGNSKTIDARSNTNKAFAYRYKNMLPATTPLEEWTGDNLRAPNRIKREKVFYDVKLYGDWLEITEELNLWDLDSVWSRFLSILGDQAGLTQETITRDTVFSGTNVIFADGAKSRADVAANKKRLTTTDFSKMKIKLRRQKAKQMRPMITGSKNANTYPVESRYPFLTTTSTIEDLRQLDGWRDVHTYAAGGKPTLGEQGSINGFAVIDYDLAPEIDVNGTQVHLGLAIGKDAFVTTSVKGQKAIQVLVVPIDRPEKTDPLAMRGTMGWKGRFGAAIMNQAWLMRTEQTVSIEDKTPKHYYDYK